MSRHVVHVNIVSFFVSVARALQPKLVSYPVAVTTAGASQRALLDISSQAFEAGVRRGMLVETARRKCRDLVVLTPTPGAYEQAHRALIDEAVRLSPRVESAGPGHVFIDMSGTQRLFGSPADVADTLRKNICNKYNLPPTVGLAANKLVSKIATRVIKPVGFCTVVPGCEEEFIGPLPVHFMPGIESDVIRKLTQFNIFLFNDLHSIAPSRLAQALGNVAFDIHRFSRGIDTIPVRQHTSPEPVIEEETVFEQQTNDERIIEANVFRIAVRAGTRLRAMGLGARRILLGVTYADGSMGKRSCAVPSPVCGDISLFERCMGLFKAVYTRRIRLRSLTCRLSKLSYPYGQMDLFMDTDHETRLMKALDAVRGKYGTECLQFGRAAWHKKRYCSGRD